MLFTHGEAHGARGPRPQAAHHHAALVQPCRPPSLVLGGWIFKSREPQEVPKMENSNGDTRAFPQQETWEAQAAAAAATPTATPEN